MKFLFIFLASICLNISCFRQPAKKFSVLKDGRFEEDGMFSKFLLLKNGEFVFYRSGQNFDCCDTISKGFFVFDKGLLYLSSFPDILDDHLPMDILEMKLPNQDSIDFTITNPVEEDSLRGGRQKNPKFFFDLTLFLSSKTLTYIKRQKATRFSGSYNRLYIEPDMKIDSFLLWATPNYPFLGLRANSVTQVTFPVYKVANSLTNSFKINIPKLTLSYLAYDRLRKDMVKIISPDVLEWNGLRYIRSK